MHKAYLSIILVICLFSGSFMVVQNKQINDADLLVEDMEAFYDSMLKVKPTIDTVETKVKGETVYIEHPFEPVAPELLTTYDDSIVNDSIDARIEIRAVKLAGVKWTYKPVYKKQTITITQQIPIYNKCPEVEAPKSKPISLLVGLNSQIMPVVGVGYKRLGAIVTYTDKPLLMAYYKF